MKLQINLINEGELPNEIILAHYRSPEKDALPELVAQYPMSLQTVTQIVVDDFNEGDIIKSV